MPIATPQDCHSGTAWWVTWSTPPAMWESETVVMAAATAASRSAVPCWSLSRRSMRADIGCLDALRGCLRDFGRGITLRLAWDMGGSVSWVRPGAVLPALRRADLLHILTNTIFRKPKTVFDNSFCETFETISEKQA